MVKCPECGEDYQQLGQHWYYHPSHRPEVTQKQLEIITGLLMSDGWLNKHDKNSFFAAKMISQNYLKYVDNIFGCLGTGVSMSVSAKDSAQENKKSGFNPNAKEENYSDLYTWKTRNHPKFNEFREWYSSGKKVWPEDIELTPTVLKHWYVGDGSFSNSSISITMCNEAENTEKVSQYFTNVGLPKPSNYNLQENEYGKTCTARFTISASHEIFKYMGGPLPDFEYKWPEEYH